jgi:hypothetical protein
LKILWNFHHTRSDIDPLVLEHTNLELLHHMQISTTNVSSVGTEAKLMEMGAKEYYMMKSKKKTKEEHL